MRQIIRSIFFLPALLFGVGLPFGAKGPELRLEGQEAFSSKQIESLTGFPEISRDWKSQNWDFWADDAASLLREAYRDLGYFEAQVDVHTAFGDSSGGDKPPILLIQIKEGRQFKFASVNIQLPEGMFPIYNPGDLRCREGRPFDKTFLYRDRRDILKFYGDAGFLKAQASESLFIDTAQKGVRVNFLVNPGRALVFDTLVLNIQREGDTSGKAGKSSPRILRDLFTLRRGDTLSLRDISKFERKLKSTRVYNFVRIRDSLLPDPSQPSALVLNAEEKTPGELDASMFWETLYGYGGSLGWSHANLGGHLQEGHTTLTFAQRKQSLFLGYGAPLLFGSSIRFDNDFVVNWYQDKSPARYSDWFQGDFDISNQSKFSRQLFRWMRVQSGMELLGKSTLGDSARQRDFNLNYINSFLLEQLDDPVNPSRGARSTLTWGNGGPILKSGKFSVFQNRHNWIEARDAFYLPFGHWLVAAFRLDGGRFFGKGGINSDRFFLGGSRSIRSEDWRSVCPDMGANLCNDDIEPAYFLTSGELRFQPFQPLWISTESKFRYLFGLQVVPFLDYGNVWEVGKNLSAEGQGRAVGGGLRYILLSLFNIRVDYAWDFRDSGKRRFILDLSQAF